ncbi:MAG TPA: DHA2 family efflux MFS transporter permease subunit [Ilumatobacter sp.]|nr:DHA2 family efflux MFS transporter permease subunit [Ilumatobacter sp.]
MLAVASIASFMVALDLLVVTTSLDSMRRSLGADASELQWTVTAYSVTFASMLMAGAALGDRFGRRRLLIAGLAVFVVGSAMAALSPNVGLLLGARVIQGCGGAIVLPVSLAMVVAASPLERRGAAIGALEGITGLAVIAGPVVGGVVTQQLSWQWVFWINVPVGVLAIALVLAVVPESQGEARSVDAIGTLLVAGTVFAAVWGLTRGNDAGWGSAEVVGVLIATAVFGVGFVAWQIRAPRPMLSPQHFRSRQFCAGVVAAALLSAALYGSVFFMAQMLQISLGHDPIGAGLRLLPWTATRLIVAPLTGRLSDRLGVRPVMLTGLIVASTGFAWLAAAVDPDVSYRRVLGPLIVIGLGMSASLPVSQAAVIGAVPAGEVGAAAGTVNVLQELGGSVGVAVSVAVFVAHGGYTDRAGTTHAMGAVFLGCAALAAVAGVAAAALPQRHRSGRATSRDEFTALAGSTQP